MTARDIFDQLLNRFDDYGFEVDRQKPSHAMVQCPVHGDRNPSLAVDLKGGKILLHCHAECDSSEILARIGWTWDDLKPDRAADRKTVVAEYPYTDESGNVLYVKERYDPKDFRQYVPQPGGGKRYKLDGVPRVLFRLPAVKIAIEAGEAIFLCEGEKDVEAVEAAGKIATTWDAGAWKPGARPKWRDDYSKQLAGAHVILLQDRDDDGQGQGTARDIAGLLMPYAASVTIKEAAKGKDAHDHLVMHGLTIDDFVTVEPYRSGGPSNGDRPGAKRPRFTVGSFAEVTVRSSTYLLPGWLPDEELVVFVGEEGIGKGLFCVDCISRVTRAGHNVLIVATEDDFERVLRPRLDVAGADVSRCFFMVIDPATLQGQPMFPANILEVREVITRNHIRLVYIDPWVSSVSGGLKLRDTQDARRAIDPLAVLARSTHSSILAVAHPNRGEGDIRSRVGLTAVLRQAARIMLYALEPPNDDTKLIVGVEMANNARRAPATVYHKVPRDHPALTEQVWAIEEDTEAPPLTIRQWHDRFRPDRDRRVSDRWPEVVALAARTQGLVQRADIVAIYESSSSDESAADKAISRWVRTGLLSRSGHGVYEVIEHDA